MPCYNEEAVLPQTIKVIGALLKKLIKGKKVHADSKVCFVNDGSSDKTWALIKKPLPGSGFFGYQPVAQLWSSEGDYCRHV